jgi:hypothetical protein
MAGLGKSTDAEEDGALVFRPHFRSVQPALAAGGGQGSEGTSAGTRGIMSNSASLLETIDRVCGQFAAALQHSQLQVYATIALVTVLSVLLFPPKNDPDQI